MQLNLMFKYLCFLLLILGSQKKEDSIVWSENYRLQWSDFKADPDQFSDAVAITASGLTFNLSATTTSTKLLDYSAKVTAHFYPYQSWCKKEVVDSIVLAHEQLHFDITELHARKFRKLVTQKNFSLNIKKELSQLQNRINKDLKEFQNKYDKESDFSRNVETQKYWQALVNQMLKELSDYQ